MVMCSVRSEVQDKIIFEKFGLGDFLCCCLLGNYFLLCGTNGQQSDQVAPHYVILMPTENKE